ncbi:hypothetical protein EJ110_NYTH24567 [Nymphaea thermarum]|nr:hypothetical protein EJ110_NYTH24567 [Nymphaea thermarum]
MGMCSEDDSQQQQPVEGETSSRKSVTSNQDGEIGNNKAPCPDGFCGEFFKKCWTIGRREVGEAVRFFQYRANRKAISKIKMFLKDIEVQTGLLVNNQKSIFLPFQVDEANVCEIVQILEMEKCYAPHLLSWAPGISRKLDHGACSILMAMTHNNFLLWKTQILALIESQDMEGFLTGSIAAPPSHIINPADPQQLTSNPKFESWRRSDRLIKGWIIGTLSETVLGLVVRLNSSQEIGSTLIDAFAQESQERGFHLTHMLTTCKKGNDALEVYVAKFKAICDDLAAIGKSVGDKEKAF